MSHVPIILVRGLRVKKSLSSYEHECAQYMYVYIMCVWLGVV